jgi:prepilin-type processing-associated H-X9-DG protein
MSLPAVMEQKNRTVCASNLRNISAAISAYSASNDGNMPANNSSTSWWKELYPNYCSSKAIFSCPLDKTGFTDPANVVKGKLSYGPLGWDSSSNSASAFNKKAAMLTSPAQSVVLAEYFSKNRAVDAMNAWNYPGTVANATYAHQGNTKTALLFLDGHVTNESEVDIREKIKTKDIINSF